MSAPTAVVAADDLAQPGGQPASPAAPRRSWRNGDFSRMFAVVLGWQLALTVLGTTLELVMLPRRGADQPPPLPHSLLTHTYFWDGHWFHGILTGEYATNPAMAAFYPLFPFTVWLTQQITFNQLGFLAAGLLVNTVATWLGATALLKIARHFVTGERAAWLVVMAFLAAPTAMFLHAFYSEATFIALGFWAYLFALRRQWLWMGLCLMPLTASRITAVLFVGLCFLEFWRSRNWRLRGLVSWPILWFPASIAGFLAYALYLRVITGDALGMTKAYDANPAWGYHVFNLNIFETLGKQLARFGRILTGQEQLIDMGLVDVILPMVGLALLLLASGYLMVALRGAGVPLGVFGVLSFVMFTLNSNTVSVHRYLLPCLVLYVALVVATQRIRALRGAYWGVLYVSVMLQSVLLVLAVGGYWTG
ncbi:DUF2079 domain-containing protein [Goodfellowiella coeruleoviolacea]|uniref:Mannosyltransferase PIG-V n=1 Tax=Goodfellowiella coeruleoviolacea TaxID=334858 RepID=A0AAE3KKC2_9PSEU|nr:DUF2079 domain-containing protein [Goodfellowiella coeruleoviolacea]MCP2169219.1 hypothetical protein [Goodfellowiella coeruleoviolacea]